ncbi:MAG: cobalamin-dependent protein [Candidatus Bathyarchaeia archaeon]
MRSSEELFKKEAEAVEIGDVDVAVAVAREAMDAGVSPFEFLMKGICAGLANVGKKFEAKEYFYPDLVCAADTTMEVLKIIKPYFKSSVGSSEKKGTFIIGSVEGDLHDIGKDLVKTVLEASGWTVIDLGVDVPASKFVEAAKNYNADIVGSSVGLGGALKYAQKQIEEGLKEAGLRSNVKTMIGGAFADQAWADEIGADAYGKDCFDALRKAEDLLIKLKEEKTKQ